jgi:hypothetical protein
MKKIIIMSIIAGLFAVPSFAQTDNTIRTDSTSRSTTDNTSTTTVKSPPPTAVAPAVTTINNDVCAVAASGAVQTQILGISMGGTMRDMNCERIKLSKNLYDMGMKVAAVATLCQDERIFTAMIAAGTPCPVDGKIGEQAKAEWQSRGVLDKQQKEQVGHYATKPAPVKKPADTAATKETPATGDCSYTGDDDIVKSRVCGK